LQLVRPDMFGSLPHWTMLPVRRLGDALPPIAAAILLALPLAYLPLGADGAAALMVPKEWLTKVGAVLLAAAALCRAESGRTVASPGRLPLAALGLFCLFFAIAAAAASDRIASFSALQQTVVFALAFLAVASAPGSASPLLWALMGSGLLCAATVGLQELGVNPPGWRPADGMALPAGTFMHRNTPAYLIAAALPVMLDRMLDMLDRPRAWRFVAAAAGALAVLVFALVVARCRGAWLTTILGLALLLVWRRRDLLRLRAVHLALLAAVPAAVLLALSLRPVQPAGQSSILHRANVVEDSGSIHARFFLWKLAAEMIRDQPLAGIGPGQFYESARARVAGHIPSRSRDADNEIIHTAAVAGVPAALALVAFVLLLAWRVMSGARREGRRWPPILVVLLSMLVLMSMPMTTISKGEMSGLIGILLGAISAGFAPAGAGQSTAARSRR
jgi:O-antigen ligase